MRKRLIFICAIALIVPSAIGCSSTIPSQVSVDETYAEKEVEIAAGGLVTVILWSHPPCFDWELARISDPSVLEKMDSKYEPPDFSRPETELHFAPCGASGKAIWTFRALNKGKSTLYLEYSQPWEGGIKGAKTFVLTVVVR